MFSLVFTYIDLQRFYLPCACSRTIFNSLNTQCSTPGEAAFLHLPRSKDQDYDTTPSFSSEAFDRHIKILVGGRRTCVVEYAGEGDCRK